MPKEFTKEEREIINNKLLSVALDLMKVYGIKKTTVDEIVKRVGIPKGTFYLFYQSKELLQFEVLMKIHEEMSNKINEDIVKNRKNISIDSITELIYNNTIYCFESGFFNILSSSDIELLMVKLPKEKLNEHYSDDNEMVKKVLSIIPNSNKKNIEIFSDALRNIFLLMISNKEVNYNTIKLIIKGIVIQMFMEEK